MIRSWFRYWTIKLQSVAMLIAAWLTFDPVGLLNVWNMMPVSVRSMLPGNIVQIIGAVLFVLSWVTMFARVVPEHVKRPK